MRWQVTTVLSAYETYFVEAETEEEAQRIVKDNDRRQRLVDRGEWRDDGYGDDFEIVEVRPA